MKRCRDCPALFKLTDLRRRLCDECRRSKRRKIVARANRKLWKAMPAFRRHRLYKQQWQRQLEARERLSPELRGAVIMLGNLRRRISEKQDRRPA